MIFREAMEHYRAGICSDEERQLVETELEKSRLIADYLDEEWEMPALEKTAGAGEAELKKIKRNLHRRSAAIVAASVALAALILLGVLYLVLPAAERQYWNPAENSYDMPLATDLEVDFRAYTELFTDAQTIDSVVAERTGFAAYSLRIQSFDSARGGSSSHSYGSLVKDELSIPYDLLRMGALNVFERASFPEYSLSEENKARIRQNLEALPEYVEVYAAISFTEDLSMEEVMEFGNHLREEEGGHVDLVGIRNSEEFVQRYPLCGMKPWSSGIVLEGINDDYPLFELKGQDHVTPADLEQHFRSLLTYSRDRAEAGRGVSEIPPSYYEEVLKYVEEYGIYSYGCYITASPGTVLELLDSGMITQAWVKDARINF